MSIHRTLQPPEVLNDIKNDLSQMCVLASSSAGATLAFLGHLPLMRLKNSEAAGEAVIIIKL